MKSIFRRGIIARGALGLMALMGLLVGGTVQAQTWPSKPVRLVLPVGAGGTTDIMSRVLAEALQRSTGQSFIVDLKPGANGAVASQEVMRQAPDGYTLLVGTAATHGVGPAVLPNLGYSNSDFTPITRLADTPVVLLVSPKLNVRTIKEMVEYAKSKPGQVNFYSTGNGSYAHLVGEMTAHQANVKMTHIPYRGFAQAYTDLVAGTTHLAWDAIASSTPYIKDGSLRPLAVSGSKRSPVLPDVPTINEAYSQLGLQGFSTTAWFGLYGPRGMAPELSNRIAEEVAKVLKSAEISNRFTTMGLDVTTSTPTEFAAFLTADVERWRKVARDANFKPD